SHVEPPRLGTARERCELGEARVIAPTVPPGRTLEAQVAIAADREERSALVAIDGTEARDAVELWWPDAESETVSHGGWLRELEAGSLFALEKTGPDDALLVRTSACIEAGHAAQCLFARAIHVDRAHDRIESSEPARVAMAGPPTTMRIATSEGRVLVARSHHAAPPVLDTFDVDAATHALRHRERALGEGLDLERGPVEILALTTTGGSYAVLFRQGAQEASDSSVTLSTGLDEHAVPELREALVIDSMAIFTGAIVMIAAFEFAEPSWLRMGFDGELIGEPRPLPAGEDVPLPFTDRRVARVDGTPPRTIEIRDGAGHATAPLVALGPEVRMADLARFDGGFLLATLGDDANVRVSSMRCRVAGSPSATPAAPHGDDNAQPAR
ncbi:MAG: hypothetical protein K1X94_36710, partial [Sandaracinaceae bacterium]|nr:hypothetical protein [Sandaracinaceae bacterium]